MKVQTIIANCNWAAAASFVAFLVRNGIEYTQRRQGKKLIFEYYELP